MANYEFDRPPRWNTSGYWTSQRPREDWQGDRSQARSYSRADQRRYASRAVDQGERLRDTGRVYDDWDPHSEVYRGPAEGRDVNLERYGDWYEDNSTPGRFYGRRQRGYDPYREPGSNLEDNYWGWREQGRQYQLRDQDAWWNNTGGRPGYTSARRYNSDLPTRPRFDWMENRDFDLDPGYDYEFGTDFDFLNDVNMENYGQQNNLARPGSRDRGRRRFGGYEYGWQGQPYHQQARYREFWNTPGPYAGVGPEGYQRSDERLKDEVCQRLMDHGQVDSSGIAVDVRNGDVILEGDVDRREEKYMAEDLASDVMGVQNVENHIRVNANDGARVRGMGREDVVMIGRIQPGMRVAGVAGKHIGRVKETRRDGFIISREGKSDAFIPYRSVKRTNGQIMLYLHDDEIDRQNR